MSGLKRTFIKALTILSILGAMTGIADAGKPMALTAEQTASINKISAYLNSFTTLQGDFTQISPLGNVSKGTMMISKPGKLRFDYAAPNPFLLVSDGKWVTLKNRAKEKGDQFPLSATPLRLVVSPKLDLVNEANILGFEQADGIDSVTLEDKGGSIGGHIILIFDENQNQLQQWIIVDGKGRRTTVSLANLQAGVKIDPKLFLVKIERKQRDSH